MSKRALEKSKALFFFFEKERKTMGRKQLEKCEKCRFADECKKKQMVYDPAKKMLEDVTANTREEMAEPILRETMTIMVDGKPQLVYKDVIEKEIYKELYSQLRLNPFG